MVFDCFTSCCTYIRCIKVVFITVNNSDLGKLTDLELICVLDDHLAVDVRRIGAAACDGRAIFVNGIDQHGDLLTDLVGELVGTDRGLFFHETLQAFLLDVIRYWRCEFVGRGAFYWRVHERTDTIQLRFLQEIQ